MCYDQKYFNHHYIPLCYSYKWLYAVYHSQAFTFKRLIQIVEGGGGEQKNKPKW